MTSYYGQPSQNPQFAAQGANPNYGWNAQGGANQPSAGDANYAESALPKVDVNFDDRTIRAAFVRKVFIWVGVMLGVVTVMSAVPFFHPPTQHLIRTTPSLYLASYVTFLIVYIALVCCESVRRSYPSNLICTAILTLSMGYMSSMLCSQYNLESVLLTLVITTIACGAIVLFSCQTKYDLTSMMGFVFIASMVLMIFGFVAIIAAMAFHIRWLYLVYAGLAALLFMVYLAIDIQMLMGGSGRKYEMSPEDHVFAAIQIFMDIVMIFWYLLMLFGNSNN